MIRVDILRGKIAEKGFSQRQIAEHLGMTDATFYRKMAAGVFDSDEMYQMSVLLEIPMAQRAEIFFAHNVT